MELPDLPPINLQDRLDQAYTAGNVDLVPSFLADRTHYVLLYAGAVDGTGRWLRPIQVVRMTDEQAALTTTADRLAWAYESARAGHVPLGRPWYADNTRESVREVLTDVFLPLGAVVERKGLAATSPAPRWALHPAFAVFATAEPDRAASALNEWLSHRAGPTAEEVAAHRLAATLTRTARAAEAFARAFPSAHAAGAARDAARRARDAADSLSW